MSEAGAVDRVVRVLPDVAAIDKEFDYLVPAGVEANVGDVVRIELHGRRVGGWIVAADVDATPGVALKRLAKVSGRGPHPDLLDLASWAAGRWAGRRASFLRTASPPGVVGSLEHVRLGGEAEVEAQPERSASSDDAIGIALARLRSVLRLGPGADRYPLVLSAVAATDGQVLVLCPSVAEATVLGERLGRDGFASAVVAGERGSVATGHWSRAAAGAARVVIGARAAAWAPAPGLGRIVVLDEHDERYQQEQTPTWHARDVAVERAARAGVPCTLVSPCPSLEALRWSDVVAPDRASERAAWPRIEVVDQRDLDPALGPLFSPRLVDLARGGGRVVCVLNRTGRARLLACTACTTLARCEVCDAAVSQVEGAEAGEVAAFACGRCGAERPMVCTACGGARFKNLRLGVSRAAEELERLAGRRVVEVTAATADVVADPGEGLWIGTEAVLHRVPRADAVVFLDFDQELLALRFRAAEQALALLAHAGRIVRRGTGDRGLVLVQTRTPDHPVLVAAHGADPARLVRSEGPLREALGLPPSTAMALVSGASAPAFVEAFGRPADVLVQGPVDGRWRLIAPDHDTLTSSLASTPRPPGRLRIEVDPLRA